MQRRAVNSYGTTTVLNHATGHGAALQCSPTSWKFTIRGKQLSVVGRKTHKKLTYLLEINVCKRILMVIIEMLSLLH